MDSYAERIGRLLYEKTDEKQVVAAALERGFAGRRFRSALDVGAGPGLLTGPLASRSEQLTLVEIDRSYEAPLREKFPSAQVVIASIVDVPLASQSFDAILASQTLYYHPEENWLPLCRRFLEALRPGGGAWLVMNRDGGDWWEIVSRFWQPLRPYLNFHYRPLSQFVEELKQEATVTEERMTYQLRFDSEAELTEFIGRQALQLYDEAVLERYTREFRALAADFTARHGEPKLVVQGSLIGLSR